MFNTTRLLVSLMFLLASFGTALYWLGKVRDSRPCGRPNHVSAAYYWAGVKTNTFTDVKDISHITQGRFAGNTGVCFETDTAGLSDAGQRALGYKGALDTFISRCQSADAKVSEQAWKDVNKITGKSFSSITELTEWRAENDRFFDWDSATDTLVVNEYRKRTKDIDSSAVEGNEITGEEYWYRQARGQIREPLPGDPYRSLEIDTGNHQWTGVKVLETAIADRNLKLSGYRKAYTSLTRDLYSTKPDDRETAMILLQHLTGESFTQAAEWTRWENNVAQMVLSDDGEHLVRPSR